MDFDFSDDQEQLRDAVRKWVDRAYGFDRRTAIAKAGGFSAEAYRDLAGLGVCGLYVPETCSGMGMGPVEGMVTMEELGRGLVLEPVAQALICSAVLTAFAPETLIQAWLPGVAGGELLVVLAHQERNARYRLDQCGATATETGGRWTVSGAKSLVCLGDQAHAFLVPASHAGRIALFLVQRQNLDGARAAEVVFDQASADLVTIEGLNALDHAVDVGIACLCAEAVGVMDKTLAITADYMNTRKQFGVAISSFQALRHRMADMKMQLELARSMSYYASLKLQLPASERRAAMARAKYQLGNSMRFVGQQAIQLHGGIGVTDEYIVGHYVKRLTQIEMTFGDTLHHLGTVAASMQNTAGVFA